MWNVLFDSTRHDIKITNDSQPKGNENPLSISSATTFSYQVSHGQATEQNQTETRRQFLGAIIHAMSAIKTPAAKQDEILSSKSKW